MRCDRCGKVTPATIMSMFNKDTICAACQKREQEHPDYERARQAEQEALEAGDYNFPGIGLPPDLR